MGADRRSWLGLVARFRWYEKFLVPMAWGGVLAVLVALGNVWPPSLFQWFSALTMVAAAGILTVLALFRASSRGGPPTAVDP